MYRSFDIAKRSGTTRAIMAPDRRLKMLQRKLAALLDRMYRPRASVHGFVKDRSVKSNAESHLRRRFVANLDLKDYFPSISEKRVIGLLESLGVVERVAEIIARLCCIQGALPQGAPTSPVISNMICFRLDKQMQAFAKETRSIYTRYADDITISSYQPLTGVFEGSVPPAGRFSPDLLSTKLRRIVSENGFTINPEKSHYADKHSRRSVTGLRINEFINVDRRYIRNIRAALYRAETSGIAVAQDILLSKYHNPSDLAAHLQGRLAWVGHVKGRSDPTFRSLAARFNKIFPDKQLEILPTAIEMRDRSVWLIEHDGDNGSQGSAFFVSGVGLLTAQHCVAGAPELEVYHPSKPANKFTVTVANADEHRDLAILSHGIPPTEYYELELSRRKIQVGDNTTAIGYPGYGPGDRINVRIGSVSSLPIKQGVAKIEVGQTLTQGMSGGPLLDVDGEVAGIIHRGGPGEGRDFAIHVDVLRHWLGELARQ
ncbi:reverse transcriptase domain-containing protein [Devosia sp. RR2S18]|uniref:reverse transcriptase domain-containing protein n=1 Tax=Devosia rhizosphaerae TaxID=3049774 RepID=UPI00254133F9|nr:trypsin-like peptidase domain-containing protein [Devosia sp. RR2S18]WIJ26936.1 reverse transcriptase domain-containing protein [Devosia sp. RR2S18]